MSRLPTALLGALAAIAVFPAGAGAVENLANEPPFGGDTIPPLQRPPSTAQPPPGWLPLSLAFIAPFFDRRRPFRLLHLDLLVLLGLGISLFFYNRGEITTSVPLTYPVLGYFLVRTLVAGLWPRERSGPVVPSV